MSRKVIRLEHVTKIYKLFNNGKKRFLATFIKSVTYKEKLAINDVSFSVKKGESVALFGRNGAGKSTILKMITGVSYPTYGKVQVEGRVGALLELTSGFDPEFSGRENIYLKGQLIGMTNKEVEEVEDNIVEFAEVGEYIDQPLRTYSSGMKARLGFAINVCIRPDILIVDEALSVGDAKFKKKCVTKIKEMIKEYGTTLLFVTHSTGTAKEFCSRGIVLRSGRVLYDGKIEDAIYWYEESLKRKESGGTIRVTSESENRIKNPVGMSLTKMIVMIVILMMLIVGLGITLSVTGA
ncbi:MAG: ABC transporter ATP-binding protein [Anaerovoracaceae bacterium]